MCAHALVLNVCIHARSGYMHTPEHASHPCPRPPLSSSTAAWHPYARPLALEMTLAHTCMEGNVHAAVTSCRSHARDKNRRRHRPHIEPSLPHHAPVVCPVEAWVSCSNVLSVKWITSVGGWAAVDMHSKHSASDRNGQRIVIELDHNRRTQLTRSSMCSARAGYLESAFCNHPVTGTVKCPIIRRESRQNADAVPFCCAIVEYVFGNKNRKQKIQLSSRRTPHCMLARLNTQPWNYILRCDRPVITHGAA